MKLLITGANGFVGRALCHQLLATGGHEIRTAIRDECKFVRGCQSFAVGDINSGTSWKRAVTGVNAVIHLAARVHVLHEKAHDPLNDFRRTNVEATLNLARQAAAAGVQRFIFMSSIKVNGEGLSTLYSDNAEKKRYSELDPPSPCDPYSVSKWEAEQGLLEIAHDSGMEIVFLRPPLVYGPGVGANFLRLMQLIRRGVPLPFGAVANLRSMIYVGNLVDIIVLCLKHPAAANQTYLVSDGEDVSTPELIKLLAMHMRRKAHLIAVSPKLLELAFYLAGREKELHRLLGSLIIDNKKIRQQLDWQPRFSLCEGLAKTVSWFQLQSGLGRRDS